MYEGLRNWPFASQEIFKVWQPKCSNVQEKKHMFGYRICLVVHCKMVFLINGVEIRSRLYIKGETNNVRNYQIIIVNSLVKKLFRCIMEAKSTWVENNECKRAYKNTGFWKHHNTIYHIVTLLLLMEGSHLKGKWLYYCIMDLRKKAFDMVPHEHLWRSIQSSKWMYGCNFLNSVCYAIHIYIYMVMEF